MNNKYVIYGKKLNQIKYRLCTIMLEKDAANIHAQAMVDANIIDSFKVEKYDSVADIPETKRIE